MYRVMFLLFCILFFCRGEETAIRLDNDLSYWLKILKSNRKYDIIITPYSESFITCYLLEKSHYDAWMDTPEVEPTEFKEVKSNNSDSTVTFIHTNEEEHYLVIFRGLNSKEQTTSLDFEWDEKIDFNYFLIPVIAGAAGLGVCIVCVVISAIVIIRLYKKREDKLLRGDVGEFTDVKKVKMQNKRVRQLSQSGRTVKKRRRHSVHGSRVQGVQRHQQRPRRNSQKGRSSQGGRPNSVKRKSQRKRPRHNSAPAKPNMRRKRRQST